MLSTAGRNPIIYIVWNRSPKGHCGGIQLDSVVCSVAKLVTRRIKGGPGREFEAGKNQNKLRSADIAKIVKTYKAFKTVEKYAYRAKFKEVKENEFNFNIPRYVDTFEEEEEIDIAATQKEIEKLEDELAGVRKEMKGYLKELGIVK